MTLTELAGVLDELGYTVKEVNGLTPPVSLSTPGFHRSITGRLPTAAQRSPDERYPTNSN